MGNSRVRNVGMYRASKVLDAVEALRGAGWSISMGKNSLVLTHPDSEPIKVALPLEINCVECWRRGS